MVLKDSSFSCKFTDHYYFLQPAFYEAFGLTVVEAMTCGLPTFATAYGGPAEIIVHGVSGYHIDPYQGDKASELLVDFFEKCKEDSSHWSKISQGGLQRIEEKYASLFPASTTLISVFL
jgi:sucrose synthase